VIVRRVAVEGTVAFPEPVELLLPETGVVLLSSPNGGGKTSLIEAVAWACWGRGLRLRGDGRPAQPWIDGRPAEVNVVTSLVDVALKRSPRGAISHAFSSSDGPDGWEEREYENSQKSYAGLAYYVGAFDVWRRACVFSGSSAARFSRATDAERKDLLEEVLGLDAFDAALARAQAAVSRARDDVSHAEVRETSARAALDRARAHTLEAEERLARTPRWPAGLDPDLEVAARVGGAQAASDLVAARRAALKRTMRAMAAEIRALSEDRARLTAAWDERDRDRVRHRKRLAALSDAVCGECGRVVTQREAEEGSAVEREALRLLDECDDRAREVEAAIAVEVRALAAARDLLDAQDKARDADLAVVALYAAGMARRSSAQEDLDRERRHEAEVARGVVGEAAAVSGAKTALAVEEAALAALRGTRSAVLATALAGLSASANRYLARLRARFAVRLEAVTTTKAGAERDRIALHVDGAGNGEGYGGCSDGEKRRVDVALLLGVGDLAPRSRQSTLFLDEVFLHLDAEGKEAAVDLVRELARDRCVVVVEHDAEFARGLRPDVHARLERGKVVYG
jgi:DNA repair exonuclease SbcCD ATPase subunit